MALEKTRLLLGQGPLVVHPWFVGMGVTLVLGVPPGGLVPMVLAEPALGDVPPLDAASLSLAAESVAPLPGLALGLLVQMSPDQGSRSLLVVRVAQLSEVAWVRQEGWVEVFPSDAALSDDVMPDGGSVGASLDGTLPGLGGHSTHEGRTEVGPIKTPRGGGYLDPHEKARGSVGLLGSGGAENAWLPKEAWWLSNHIPIDDEKGTQAQEAGYDDSHHKLSDYKSDLPLAERLFFHGLNTSEEPPEEVTQRLVLFRHDITRGCPA